ncbi:MAG: hypothetical protein EA426_18700 [Spirochaetaceae bacterium]|nr:MAG: hypothetical protein EA426_18700 [Spirochaetaceae bacterium]
MIGSRITRAARVPLFVVVALLLVAPFVSAELPLRRITLYSSGVGHFEHAGSTSGDGGLTIAVSRPHLDDLLRTLTLEAVAGGLVRSVEYTVEDHVERALSRLPVVPGGTLQKLLASLVGEEIAVGTPPVRGRMIAVEPVFVQTGTQATRTESIRITLATADGFRTVSVGDSSQIAVADARLRARIEEALDLVRDARDPDVRVLTVRTTGAAGRELRATYIREMPVWKPTYRLVLDDAAEHLLQGWAIVENTTETDWVDVALTLVAGDPVSFRMAIADPIYQRRPEVPFPLEQGIRPPQFADALPQQPPAAAARSAAPTPSPALRSESAVMADSGFSGRGVEAAADASAQGAFHRYVVREPVSIPAGSAAMVPIVQQRIPAELISVYDPNVNRTVPVSGVEMINKTGAALSAGPITVFDRGAYAGEAVLRYLPAEGERLISFSLDRRTEVNRRVDSVPDRITAVRIDRGIMTVTSLLRRSHRYQIVSRDAAARTLIIQHRREGDWRLVSPARADQEYADGYRFRVPLSTVETRELEVVEERARSESVSLSTISADRVAFYLSQREIPQTIRSALVRVRDLQSDVTSAVAAVRAVEQSIADIEREQQRIRANMGVLAQNSDLYRRYVADLTAQEDRLVDLRRDLQAARTREKNARAALERFIANLRIG